MTLSLSVKQNSTLSITTISTINLSIIVKKRDTQHNHNHREETLHYDTQHNNKKVNLSITITIIMNSALQ
jgi:hypothetical protein